MSIAARPRTRHARGFTLIELMIAVVVVGILAAVAFPSFMDSIRKGRRAEAFTALSNIQQAQERWRANNATYAGDLSGAAPAGLGIAATTSGGLYTLSLSSATATGYEAVATAASGSSQVKDGACAKLGVKLFKGNLSYGGASSTGTVSFAATSACWSH